MVVNSDDVSFLPLDEIGGDEQVVFVFDVGYSPIDSIAGRSITRPLEQMRCL